jgi:Recombinase
MAQRRREGVHLGRSRELPVAVVERIVAERAAGRSLRAIADGLTQDGTPTAHGGARWLHSTVQAVLASTTARSMVAA